MEPVFGEAADGGKLTAMFNSGDGTTGTVAGVGLMTGDCSAVVIGIGDKGTGASLGDDAS